MIVCALSLGCERYNARDGVAPNGTDGSLAVGEDMAPERAVAVLVPVGDSGVSGTVEFTRSGDAVQVSGEVEGLSPGKHGFHVHQYGDLADQQSGKSAGGHFDPMGHEHGRPSDETRHVGDLGNIEAGDDGKASIQIEDDVIALAGPHSIVGRALVIHAQPDEFTQPTGNAGDRVAFGVIGIANPE
ncbi:MAG: superoxide dismutase family protein [Planctomycetota bacterium]|nr:MAG: superoxide dismutase family protein [Planctomycetota bacterium]